MTAHVLRLAIGEWSKVRGRWMPWILLGVVLLIVQVIFWASYVVFHVGDIGVEEPYEYHHSAGSVVITCEDVVDGSDAEKLELIASKVEGESEQNARAEVAEWRGSCAGYSTPDEVREFLTLPSGVGLALGGATLILVIPVLILAASVMGLEYGLGTLRTTLVRGVGRWQFLTGKLVMLMVVVTAWVVVIGVSAGIASLLAGVIPPAEDGTLISGEWLSTIKIAAKLAFALAPYVALGVFMAVLTQSTAMGMSLSLGYYVMELLFAPVVGLIADWLADALDVALLGANATEWMSTASTTEAQQALGAVVEQPDTLRAFLVLLAYTAVLVAAAIWLFQRRDITGARGE